MRMPYFRAQAIALRKSAKCENELWVDEKGKLTSTYTSTKRWREKALPRALRLPRRGQRCEPSLDRRQRFEQSLAQSVRGQVASAGVSVAQFGVNSR